MSWGGRGKRWHHTQAPDKPPVTIHDCTCLRETEKALLVHVENYHDPEQGFWIPKSQIEVDSSDVTGQGCTGDLTMTRWIAEQKELWDFIDEENE